jgi:microcystin-dependent protein
MSDPYIGEIRIFAGNFAPRSWAFCNGQLLSISQNTALFSLLGTNYGGDGRVTFGLPNLQDRAPMHWGEGPGLTPRSLGETAGSNSSTLSINEMPSHPHNLVASTSPASGRDPTNNPLARSRNGNAYQSVPQSQVPMAAQAVNINGNSQPHNNMQPYLGVSFIIALQGIFPPRS